jgi:hypothetical protein
MRPACRPGTDAFVAMHERHGAGRNDKARAADCRRRRRPRGDRFTPEALTQARLPLRWASRRAAAGRCANACGRLRERRSVVSLSPAVALVPRLRLGIGGAPTASLFVQLASLLRDHEDDRFARGKQQSVTIGRDAEESSAPRSTRHSGSKCADSARGQLWTIWVLHLSAVDGTSGVLQPRPRLEVPACTHRSARRLTKPRAGSRGG